MMEGTPPQAGELAIAALSPDYAHWDDVLALILKAFGYMNGVIDPPSSALRLTAEMLEQKAAAEIALAVLDGARPVACLFCDPRGDILYVGKLAVYPEWQGKGLGSLLLDRAERLARERGFTMLELQTRVELASNHAFFAARGFRKAGEGAHAGYGRPTWIVMRKSLQCGAAA